MPPPKYSAKFSRGGRDRTHASESTRALLGGDSSSEEEDGGAYGHGAGNDKVSRTKAQVEEVVIIMKDNVNKVLERGERLDDIEERSEQLLDSALSFKRKSRKVRWDQQWANMRMRLIIGGVILSILVIIIVSATAGKK